MNRLFRFVVSFLAIPAFALVSANAADWPQFRGPRGDGHVEVNELPLRWSRTDNIAWRVNLPGRGWSSPVLKDGRLYLTAAVTVGDGSEDDPKADRSLRAYCVNAADGRMIWDVEVFPQRGADSPVIHNKNGHASPTPVVDGDRLYVHFGHQGTACLDLSGKKLWEQRSLKYEPVHGAGASPLLVDGLLIFPCDGAGDPFIVALKAEDGAVAWRTPRRVETRNFFSFCSPACFTIDGVKQILSPASNALLSYDPATGRELWRVRFDGYSVIPRPLYGHGLVYFSSGYDSPVTYAVKPGGSGDVTDTNVVWTQQKRAPNTPSMLLVGDELYTVADNGVVSCLDAKTGEIHWQERAGRACSASPIVWRDRIYVMDEFGTTTVLKTGRKFEKLAENRLDGERTLASLAAGEGVLFLRSDIALYCLKETP